MQPEIIECPQRLCYGLSAEMSMAEDSTQALWMKMIPTVLNCAHLEEVYSLQEYPSTFFDSFQPEMKFRKWALAEAQCFAEIPEGFEAYTMPGGKYARFYLEDRRKGGLFFSQVFTEFLPQAGLQLRTAPHFEILPKNWFHDQGLGEWILIPIH